MVFKKAVAFLVSVILVGIVVFGYISCMAPKSADTVQQDDGSSGGDGGDDGNGGGGDDGGGGDGGSTSHQPPQIWYWGGSGDESSNIILVDDNGNIYVGGFTKSYGAGDKDALLIKYNSDLQLQWNKTWGGSKWDSILDIDTDPNGNIYIAGITASFCYSDINPLFMKYNTNGSLMWSKVWAGDYGAGAFQTLVNRDLVKAADKIMILGSGNVGLIAAYHALQAGINVAGIVEIAPEISGYKVHADKIKRMGVPIYLKTTILCAEGNGKLERVTIATVDEQWNPILETAKTFEVDTLLVAAGLSSADEFYEMAKQFEFNVVKAGDADEIAEASSAMFGGRIAGLKMAKMLGEDVVIDDTWNKKAEVLESRPGVVVAKKSLNLESKFNPNFFCVQEIPCNPCTTVCPQNAISLKEKSGTIMDIPYLIGNCIGCGICVAACPGLAISLVKKIDENFAEVMLPHEFENDFEKGKTVKLTDMDGNILCDGEVVKVAFNKKYKTHLITFKVPLKFADKIAGIRVQDEKFIQPLKEAHYDYMPENGIVCRCERVSLGEVVKFIKENNVRDVNQLKQIRVGMGACGSKTCSVQMPRVFKAAGVDWSEVSEATNRPLSVEVPLFAIVNEEKEK